MMMMIEHEKGGDDDDDEHEKGGVEDEPGLVHAPGWGPDASYSADPAPWTSNRTKRSAQSGPQASPRALPIPRSSQLHSFLTLNSDSRTQCREVQ